MAEELGTPLYVYEKDAILAQLARLKRTFPGVTILYSLKCNPFEPVCRLLAGRTCGFDAASPGEVHKALASGQTPDNILYSAPGKSLDDLQRTFDRCTLIADSLSELHRLNALASAAGKILTVGLRISPSLALGPGARPDIVQALPDKFGVDEERLPELAREFQSLTSLHLAGLHVHVRSQVLSAQALTAIFAPTAFATSATYLPTVCLPSSAFTYTWSTRQMSLSSLLIRPVTMPSITFAGFWDSLGSFMI